jgi:hypothetical protein
LLLLLLLLLLLPLLLYGLLLALQAFFTLLLHASGTVLGVPKNKSNGRHGCKALLLLLLLLLLVLRNANK